MSLSDVKVKKTAMSSQTSANGTECTQTMDATFPHLEKVANDALQAVTNLNVHYVNSQQSVGKERNEQGHLETDEKNSITAQYTRKAGHVGHATLTIEENGETHSHSGRRAKKVVKAMLDAENRALSSGILTADAALQLETLRQTMATYYRDEKLTAKETQKILNQARNIAPGEAVTRFC